MNKKLCIYVLVSFSTLLLSCGEESKGGAKIKEGVSEIVNELEEEVEDSEEKGRNVKIKFGK